MADEAMTQESFMKEALHFQPALVAYAYAKLRDYHLADDVVQDALIVLMDKWTAFAPGTSVFAFARQVVHFKVLEALRKRSRSEMPVEDTRLAAAIDQTLEECISEDAARGQHELIHALHECLAKLSKRALDLIDGFYRDSKSYEELSRLHGQSLEAIRKALYRYRRILQECSARRLQTRSAT